MTSATVTIAQVLAGAPYGGAENYYTRMVCALASVPELKQIAFTRPVKERIETIQASGVATQCFRFGGKLDLLGHRRYRKALQALNPDVVLTYMNRASGLTPAGDYKLACRLGHYYDLKYYRHADAWIGITKGICDHLVRGGMDAANIVQIPNFADETPVSAYQRSDFVAGNEPLLLAAGRLHHHKGFDVLLKAMPAIPNGILLLAGGGPEEKALKALALDLGISERVTFLGWRNDVAALMETADIFVCPSRHEGLGSIVVESWFHGCPIVATDSQGPGELIDHTHTGVITPIDEVDALADAINGLLLDKKTASKLAENAKAEYTANYSKSVIVNQYAEFFHSLRRAAV